MRRLTKPFFLPTLCCALTVGCAKDDAGGKPRVRPPALVRVDKVTVEDVAPKVIVVGTVTAKRKSIVASGANGVVAEYSVDEGQWVEVKEILSVLRMSSSDREIAEAKSVEKERDELRKETKSYRREEVAEAGFKKAAAEKTWETAKTHVARMKIALNRNAINQDQYEEALERSVVAEALFRAASSASDRLKLGPRIEQQEQARFRHVAQQERVKFLEAEQAKRTTKAPFAGYVVREHTYVGQWLSKGDPVVTLAMLDDVDIIVNVDQKYLRHIHLGELADVAIPGYELTTLTTKANETIVGIIRSESINAIHIDTEIQDDSTGKTSKTLVLREIAKSDIVKRETDPWKGEILQIVPQSDWESGSRGFPVKVRVPNRFRMQKVVGENQPRKLPVLKEGMIAIVTFHGAKVPTLLVPKDALVRTTHGVRVNIFHPSEDSPDKGRTTQITVVTGVSLGDRIQVTVQPTNDGETAELDATMEVVTEGGERLLPVQGDVVAKRESETTTKPESKSKN